MSTTADFLLADARASLERVLGTRPQTDIAIVFSYWVLPTKEMEGEAKRVTAAATQRSGAQQDFQTVALLGFALNAGLFEEGTQAALKQGLERLAGRTPFVDEVPMPFCSDAVGLLGVSLGTREIGDPSISSKIIAWLSSFLKRIDAMDGTDDWQRSLFYAADHVLGGKIGISANSLIEAADARVVLRSKAILPPVDTTTNEHEELSALKLVAGQSSSQISFARAVTHLAALKWVTRSTPVAVPGRMTSSDVVRLLDRIPAGLRNWTWEKQGRTPNSIPCQWHIDNEYHVQNLLWLVLSPIFPDLDDEQYLSKIGQKNPRADFHIPSMKVMVEAKFFRSGDKPQKMIDEIAADASLYCAMGNDCIGVIPFIWDDAGRSNEHDYLKQGLRKLPGVVDAIVISRPNDWR